MKINGLVFALLPQIGFALAPAASALERVEAAEPHMGTLVRVVAYAETTEQAHAAIRKAFARVREIDDRLSDYKQDNELDRLCRTPAGTAVAVSEDLFTVLESALKLSEKTGGAFDVTIGRQTKQWRSGARPAGAGRYRQVRLDRARRTVTLLEDGIRLDFGGIAKGYAADEVLQILALSGVSRALVAVSGDIAVGDAPPGKDGWRIGIGGADRVETLTHCAVSTSGDTEQAHKDGGETLSHVLDARTGQPLKAGRMVTVIAKRGIDADSLSTAMKILGPSESRSLARQFPGARFYFSGE